MRSHRWLSAFAMRDCASDELPPPARETIRGGGVGRTVASSLAMPRKVRAPQGTVPGNAWAARADGKCNRKIPPMALSPLCRHPIERVDISSALPAKPAKCFLETAKGWQGSGKGEMVR